jgi:hypothetical protein
MNYLVEVKSDEPGQKVYLLGATRVVLTKKDGQGTAELTDDEHRIRAEEIDIVLDTLFDSHQPVTITMQPGRQHITITGQA